MSRFGGPTVSRPGKADCSKLALALARLALHHGSQPGVNTLADVTAAVKRDVPEVSHDDVVSALVESTKGSERTTTEIQSKINQLKTQARREYRQMEPQQRSALQKQIADLKAKLDAPAEVAAVKTKDLPASKDINKLIFERDKIRRQIRGRIEAMKPRGFWGQAHDIANIPKSVKASLDASHLLRQGGLLVAGDPRRAGTMVRDTFKAIASPEQAHTIMREIEGRESAAFAHSSGLEMTELGVGLNKREESFASRLIGDDTWFGRNSGLAASQRGFTVGLNRLRADTFDALTATLARNGEPTLAEGKAIANFVNIATGRGKIPAGAQGWLPALNTAFFSPRYVASRFQYLALQPLYGGTARTRKLIAKEYAKSLSGTALVYTLAAAAGYEAFWDDPTSSKFGKIPVGNTSVDPLMGLSQSTAIIGRMYTGENPDNDPSKKDTRSGMIGNFLRSKMSPTAGVTLDALGGGKHYPTGEPMTGASVGRELLVPIQFGDVLASMKDHGVPEGTALFILNALGMGTQFRDKEAEAGTKWKRDHWLFPAERVPEYKSPKR